MNLVDHLGAQVLRKLCLQSLDMGGTEFADAYPAEVRDNVTVDGIPVGFLGALPAIWDHDLRHPAVQPLSQRDVGWRGILTLIDGRKNLAKLALGLCLCAPNRDGTSTALAERVAAKFVGDLPRTWTTLADAALHPFRIPSEEAHT